ncbi:Trp biosynthesis-associated membrane protein [Nocardioides sp. LHG3406-4]|uniref:Trp biosynthesis-associated membrane protein n=1 Tax=Nocardioides sp. LHG3406-4 TaxID=2804575 RepID=UPI003CFA0A7B
MAERRRTFGPVVLLGLAGAGLSAVAGTKAWLHAGADDVEPGSAYASVLMAESGVGQMPLAGALALVLLACWGVVLVTRGRVRRVVTWLALLTALGLAATVVAGWFTLDDQFRTALRDFVGTEPEFSWTAWFWAAVVGALLSLAAAVAAVRFVRSWPEMGSKYDAPASREPKRPDPASDESQELWKAIDEGRDPTG